MIKEKCSFCNKVVGKFKAVASPKAMICEQCIKECVDLMKADENGELVSNMKITKIILGSSESEKVGSYKGYFDGSSKGNPGPAQCGYVVIDHNDNEVHREGSIPLGVETNNYAEYMGLIYLLNHLISINAQKVEIMGDSNLVVQQTTGKWKANAKMDKLLSDVRKLLSQIPVWCIRWIPREENSIADDLAQN